MILLNSNNDFLLNIFISLLNQLNIKVSSNKNDPYFAKVELLMLDKQLKIISSKVIKTINLPTNINIIKKNLLKQLEIIRIVHHDFDYLPFNQLIISNDKKVFLTDIQNKIFTFLLLNKDGINKKNLYKKIWENDKDLYINKLETHLSNLKNLLLEKSNLKLRLNTHEGKLILKSN